MRARGLVLAVTLATGSVSAQSLPPSGRVGQRAQPAAAEAPATCPYTPPGSTVVQQRPPFRTDPVNGSMQGFNPLANQNVRVAQFRSWGWRVEWAFVDGSTRPDRTDRVLLMAFCEPALIVEPTPPVQPPTPITTVGGLTVVGAEAVFWTVPFLVPTDIPGGEPTTLAFYPWLNADAEPLTTKFAGVNCSDQTDGKSSCITFLTQLRPLLVPDTTNRLRVVMRDPQQLLAVVADVLIAVAK